MIILLLPFSVHAKMYKWVDENGQTIYSESPPPGQQVETIKAAPPPPPAPNNEVNDLVQRAADAQEDREIAKQAAADKKKKSAENKSNCQAAKHNMAGLNGPPQRLIGIDGDYRRLTPDERARIKKETEKDIKKFCK